MRFSFPFNRKNKPPRTSRPPCRRRPTFETLEDRVVPTVSLNPQTQGLVSGTVFHDLNSNGALDTTEPGATDQHTVYVDANNNGQLDPGEIASTTDANGLYQLALDPGLYKIRLAPAPTEMTTWPTGGSYDVTVRAGFEAGSRDFGTRLIDPAQPLPAVLTPFPDAHQSSDEHYVQDLYRKILGRDGEPAGVAFWLSQLHAGQPSTDPASEFAARTSVALQIWHSAEHRGLQVESYYQLLLHRNFDAGGKTFWVNGMLAGASETDVVQGFLTSAEYQGNHPGGADFVTALYNDLLGHKPDTTGPAAWQQLLQQGAPRTAVVAGFLFSTELLTDLVESYYEAFLTRPAEPGAPASWVAVLQQGTLDTTEVGARILASTENILAGQVNLGTQPNPGPQQPIRGGQSPDDVLMPSPTVTPAEFLKGKVLVYDQSAQLKTITITNNSDQTVYPILQGSNSRTTATNDSWYGTPVFDPADTLNNEYRGYVGYKKDGKTDVLGLPKHETIVINVPLAFWDGGRLNIATDPNFLTPPNPTKADQTPVQNPFHYHDYNTAEQNLGSTTGGSDELTFTGLQGNPGVTPATLLNTANPTSLLVTGPGIQDQTFVKDVGATSIHLTKPAQWVDSSNPALNKNQAYNFTWPLPATKKDTPPGPATYRYTVDAVAAPNTIANGRIMWYHALTAETPANDAPAQLLEMTYRDKNYLSSLPTVQGRIDKGLTPLIPKAELTNLVNYDVSYVDSILAPVAMEAPSVPLNPAANSPDAPPYGWVGASQALPDMQGPIATFVSQNTPDQPNKNGLGQYFDANGDGYPSYYVPQQYIGSTGIKLPSGQNLVADSPFNNVRSSFDNNQFTLTSGGGVTQVTIGGQDGKNGPGQNYLILSTDPSYLPMYKALKAALDQKPPAVFEVTASQPGTDGQDYVPKGTTLKSVEQNKDGTFTGKVFLNGTTVGNPKPSTAYAFTKPVSDYAAGRLLNLWYSWANYFVTNIPKDVVPRDLQGGTIDNAGDRVITFKDMTTLPPLVPGMLVTGPGTTLPDGTRILRVEGNQVFLNQDASLPANSQPFHFALPTLESLAGYNDPQVGTPVTFTDLAGEKVDPFLFAQNAYSVLASMSTIPSENSHPRSLQVLLNVIGCNVGKLPNIGNTTTDNKDAKSDIANEIRDLTKSLLRGVVDFTTTSESDWYPDPSVRKGGQSYNVYNLDPFVWFVHKKLGLSGYGFSVDDDVADVGADQATKLHIAVGGLGAHGAPNVLPQKAEWTYGAPYGPIALTGQVSHTDPPKGSGNVADGLNTISLPDSDLNQKLFWELFFTDKKAGFVGAIVNGPGVPHGTVDAPVVTRFAFRVSGTPGVAPNKFLLDQPLDPNVVQPGTDYTFSFYGPVSTTGVVDAATPKVITISDPDVIAQLKVIFVSGALVRVDGPAVLTKGTKIVNVTDTTVEVDNALSPVGPKDTTVRFTFS
jgi:hypothetical protein